MFAASTGLWSVTDRSMTTRSSGALAVILLGELLRSQFQVQVGDDRPGDLRAGGDVDVGLHAVLDEVVALGKSLRIGDAGRGHEHLDGGLIHLRRRHGEGGAARDAEDDEAEDQRPSPAQGAQVVA